MFLPAVYGVGKHFGGMKIPFEFKETLNKSQVESMDGGGTIFHDSVTFGLVVLLAFWCGPSLFRHHVHEF